MEKEEEIKNNDEKKKMKKGLWSPEEDEKLTRFMEVSNGGQGCWSEIATKAGLKRCGKSCRLRWINYLRPDLKRGVFSPQEEDLIFHLHSLIGNRWSQIAARLPGRTDNEVKNFWNCTLKKRLKNNSSPSTIPYSSSSDPTSIFNGTMMPMHGHDIMTMTMDTSSSFIPSIITTNNPFDHPLSMPDNSYNGTSFGKDLFGLEHKIMGLQGNLPFIETANTDETNKALDTKTSIDHFNEVGWYNNEENMTVGWDLDGLIMQDNIFLSLPSLDFQVQ